MTGSTVSVSNSVLFAPASPQTWRANSIVACQFHPEFQSKPNKPHPLFKAFVTACLQHGS